VQSEADRDNDDLDERERQLLKLVREGKVDAEIAVQLGISNAEVKERIERLIWRHGALDRADLRSTISNEMTASQTCIGPSSPTPSLSRWKVSTVALAVLAVALAGVVVVLWTDRNTPASEPASALMTPPPPITLTPTPPVLPTTVAGRRMYDAGQLFKGGAVPIVGSGGVVAARVETRESLLVVELERAAVVRYREGTVEWRLRGGGTHLVILDGQVGSGHVQLVLVAQEGTEFVFGDDDSVAVYSRGNAGPMVAIWVQAPDGPSYYHTELLANGHLYIAEDSVPRNLPVAFDTGELLGLSGATQIGETHLSEHRIYCDPEDGAACTSLLRGDFTPSRPGTLTCNDLDGTLTFATLDFVLFFQWSTTAVKKCQEPVRRIPAGEPLGYPDAYEVSARDAHAAPLSVVIARDGTVYLGELTPKYGCPCRTGS